MTQTRYSVMARQHDGTVEILKISATLDASLTRYAAHVASVAGYRRVVVVDAAGREICCF